MRNIFPLLIGLIPSLALSADEVRFNRDVRPILSKNCFACHGFDVKAREAELRLDIAENAYGKAKSGMVAIVPGKVEESELWKRINLSDPDEIMPPPKHHHPLDNEQKAVLKRWIEQGAKYEGHWAFVKAEMPTLPAGTKDGAAVIDGFDPVAHAASGPAAEAGRLTAPMPGKVIAFLARAGQAVRQGQPLAVMEAMKMEHTITAPRDGTVTELLYAVGDQVDEGGELLRLEVAA